MLVFPARIEATGSTGRSDDGGETLVAWWGADLTVKPAAEAFKLVWVDLDTLYRAGVDESAVPVDADRRDVLVLTGNTQGRLRGWCRATDGRWIGLVDFELYDRAGRKIVTHIRAAVPATVLTPIQTNPRR